MVEKCTVGSRAMVMNGTCEKTSGGLKKTQLKYNPNGKIVSKAASERAKKNKNLGVFLVKKGSKGFEKIPKKGTKAYKAMLSKKSSKKSSSKKSSSKKSSKKSSSKKSSKRGPKKGSKNKKKSGRCPKGSRKSKSGKSCLKK